TRPLWGGAVSAAMPSEYMDASDVRQVPDNQEVYLALDSAVSVVMDILEPPEVEEPAKAHFEQLAEDNGSVASQVCRLESLSPERHRANEVKVWGLVGTQEVNKFNSTTRDTLTLSMLVIRLERVDADLLLTVNDP
ncbi:hypothetical protein BJ684DRAFT_3841, partial [Piptocephalis cylindrospora]